MISAKLPNSGFTNKKKKQKQNHKFQFHLSHKTYS